jgi:hypothetical protein
MMTDKNIRIILKSVSMLASGVPVLEVDSLPLSPSEQLSTLPPMARESPTPGLHPPALSSLCRVSGRPSLLRH